MTHRERLLTTLRHEEPDRVPVGYDAHEGVTRALCAHYGAEDRRALFDALDIEAFSIFSESYVAPRYAGPERVTLEDGTRCDPFGIDSHQRHLPLAFAETVEDLDRYRWPEADWWDYGAIADRCRAVRDDDWLVAVGEGGCGIQHAINLRGYEQAVIDPLVEPDLCTAYMERMGDFFVEWNRRWIAAADGGADLFRCGDEIGSNDAPHFAPDTWRAFHKPQLARLFGLAREQGLIIWFHCCGCCRPVLEDLIEIGVDLWDPVPGYVKGNDQKELKRLYGDRLSFVGGVDQPGVLVQGTPHDVEEEVKRCLDIFAPGGGYILGASQVLTEDVPLKNAVAFFEAAVRHGKY